MDLSELIFGFLNGEVTAIDFRSSIFALAAAEGKDEKDVLLGIATALAGWLDEDVSFTRGQLTDLEFRIKKELKRKEGLVEVPPT